eukprot:GCRY01003632.1.p1 GENE.GCRY01003632.1~~GCRY01003632.1.p1  ORF type:complete len:569 (+),score=157.88 GCRY01003632.1:93-1799(+)
MSINYFFNTLDLLFLLFCVSTSVKMLASVVKSILRPSSKGLSLFQPSLRAFWSKKEVVSGNHEDKEVIGALDCGTTSVRFIAFNKQAEPIAQHQIEFDLIQPQPGWAEHDPLDVLKKAKICMHETAKKAKRMGYSFKGVGLTNHRESVVVWDKKTGNPLYNSILWLDTRTKPLCDTLIAQHGSKDVIRESCGLPIDTYFSATKLRWLCDNVPEIQKAVDEGRAAAGTVDSWLLYGLTGRADGGAHATDVSNASRTLLMDLASCKWSEECMKLIGLPEKLDLPVIKSSAEHFGTLRSMGPILDDVPVAGILGDQQSALVGQGCFERGTTKNTYGTGCFMLQNTGTDIVLSKSGLLTTAAFQLGPTAPVHYALEGSVAIAGSGVQWLRDQVGLLSSAPESESIAAQVADTAGVYFVPAFSGLFAPYWRSDARGVLVGLTRFSTRHHIVRAVLESVAFQTKDVLDAMEKDVGVRLDSLRVDGGMTENTLFMQIQADIAGIDIAVSPEKETTALGAAYAAGLATGFWKDTSELHHIVKSQGTVYAPTTQPALREEKLRFWHKAIERSLGWVE